MTRDSTSVLQTSRTGIPIQSHTQPHPMRYVRVSAATNNRAGVGEATRQLTDRSSLGGGEKKGKSLVVTDGRIHNRLLLTGHFLRTWSLPVSDEQHRRGMRDNALVIIARQAERCLQSKIEQHCSYRPEKWPVSRSKALRSQTHPLCVAQTATLPLEHERIPYQFSMSSFIPSGDHAMQGCQPDTRDNRMVLLKAVRERGNFLMILASTNHSQHHPV